MKKHGKKYVDAAKKAPQGAVSVAEAVAFVKANAFAKFDESVELGMRMLAVTSHALYSYIGARREWRAVYTFNTWLTPARIDFTPVRLGSEDRLLIAYGGGQALL